MIGAPIFKPPRKLVIKIKARVLADKNPDQTIKQKTGTSTNRSLVKNLGYWGKKLLKALATRLSVITKVGLGPVL
jgi:hypothetical protein